MSQQPHIVAEQNALEAPEDGKKYTYADYAKWDDGKRWELIEGVSYLMSPAPTYNHQSMLIELGYQFRHFLRDKPCKVFWAPFDVRLNGAGDDDDTVVQPDLLVICDLSKLTKTGCEGAPDLVVEILSPGTARHDRLVKFRLYKNAGVKEYWIIDPELKIVSVNILNAGRYISSAYGDTDIVPVSVLEELSITMVDVFADLL